MSDRWPQFDIKRDIETVNAGGFFCQACVVGKPLDDISPDPRYCQDCYDVLMFEASLLPKRGINKRPEWIPRKEKPKDTETAVTTPSKNAEAVTSAVTASGKGHSKHPDAVTTKIRDM